MTKNIFITGGAGYIGSITTYKLLKLGYNITVFDNFEYGHTKAIKIIKNLTNKNLTIIDGDLKSTHSINQALASNMFNAVIHFASYLQVGESVINPYKYYKNNVIGGLYLLNAMLKNNISNIIFSSTAAIFGIPKVTPINEKAPKQPINPYGKSKLMFEEILNDFDKAYKLKSIKLRYFNAAGALSDGMLGEDHQPETHLIPLILKVALNQKENISVYGNDYNTKDGSAIRDYIHVEDLAQAHISALEYLLINQRSASFNLGTGIGYSVYEIIEKIREITNHKIPIIISERRKGDPAKLIADPTYANNLLNWKAKKSIDDIISSAWKWHSTNPQGYNQ